MDLESLKPESKGAFPVTIDAHAEPVKGISVCTCKLDPLSLNDLRYGIPFTLKIESIMLKENPSNTIIANLLIDLNAHTETQQFQNLI